jgi:hypothetical protein
MSAESPTSAIPAVGPAARVVLDAAGSVGLRGLSQPVQIIIMLLVEFGLMILVSLITRPCGASVLGPFYARLHTPVGKEDEVRWDDPPHDLPESAALGLDGPALDYRKSSRFAYPRLQSLGLEIPRFTPFDCVGFLVAWLLVGGLIWLLMWLARLQ